MIGPQASVSINEHECFQFCTVQQHNDLAIYVSYIIVFLHLLDKLCKNR